MITVLGLGPGSRSDLSLQAWETIRDSRRLYLRTARHPCVAALPSTCELISFDEIYLRHDDFEAVYAEIAGRILTAAREGQDVVYAVPGDPLVGEATVTEILQRARAESIEVEIVHGISFLEPCLSLLGIDALDGLQVLDALTVSGQ